MYFSIASLLAIFIVIGIIIFKNSSGSDSKNVFIWQKDDIEFGDPLCTLQIATGKVTVIRNKESFSYQEKSDLYSGDIIKTGDGTFAEISINNTTILIDSNSEILIKDKDSIEIVTGLAYINSSNDPENSLKINTDLTEFCINEASILVSHEGNITENASESLLIKQIYAEEPIFTEILVLNGFLDVKTDLETTQLKKGDEFAIKMFNNSPIISIEEVDKRKLDTTFIRKIIKYQEVNDLGILSDFNSPIISITSPKNNAKLTVDNTVVKFSLNEDGYFFFDGEWKEAKSNVENAFEVKLDPGENTLIVKAKDVNFNSSSNQIVVTYNPQTTVITPKITLTGRAVSNGIAFTWTVSGIEIKKGFKLIKSLNHNPTFPENDSKYITENNIRSYTWEIKDGKSYYFRICQYNGLGDCLKYSNEIKLTAPTPLPDLTTIQLSGIAVDNSSTGGFRGITLNWELTSGSATQYKICKSIELNPTYGTTDDCNGVESTTYNWGGLIPGTTYHFRVGKFNDDGTVKIYSNDFSVVAP